MLFLLAVLKSYRSPFPPALLCSTSRRTSGRGSFKGVLGSFWGFENKLMDAINKLMNKKKGFVIFAILHQIPNHEMDVVHHDLVTTHD